MVLMKFEIYIFFNINVLILRYLIMSLFVMSVALTYEAMASFDNPAILLSYDHSAYIKQTVSEYSMYMLGM